MGGGGVDLELLELLAILVVMLGSFFLVVGLGALLMMISPILFIVACSGLFIASLIYAIKKNN